jgi:hypothetical protein
MTTAKRRGAEAEIWPVEYALTLKLEADHIRQISGRSMPDIKVVTATHNLYVIQCKARKNLSITKVLREAQHQAENYMDVMGLDAVPRSALLIRPYGMGRASIGQWPLVQTFEQFLTY